MTNSRHEQLSQERKRLQAEGRLPPWYSTPAWQMFKSRYLVEEEGDVRTRFRKLAQLARYLPEPYATEYEQKFYDLALIDLETAITLQPNDANIYLSRAELYLKMKRYTAAKQDLDCAVALGIPRAALSELYKQCD